VRAQSQLGCEALSSSGERNVPGQCAQSCERSMSMMTGDIFAMVGFANVLFDLMPLTPRN
jgi:hypothetical protein